MSIEQAWWAHLANVRWFGGKGSDGAIRVLEPLGWYTPLAAVPAVRSEIATIDYSDGRSEFYHLLVAHYPAGTAPVAALETVGDIDIVDATTDTASIRAFVTALQRAPGDAMEWTRPLGSVPPNSVRVWTGEQSNTTLTLADTALFKVFRKIEPGPSLDAEVLLALSSADVAVPGVFGRLTAPWPDGQTTDLGVVMDRIQGARDGWELATAACASGTDFSDEARALGGALAAIHAALLAAFGEGTASGAATADVMADRVAEAARVAPVLAPLRAALEASFDALRGRALAVQRVHGDFHLGQTLHSRAGWTIIDFEGEPLKSAAERRSPDSVWRDVAGMMRSFDYARSAHHDPASHAAVSWARDARSAFCEGYCDGREIPLDLLAAYEADKAIYEVVYEVRNRPDWVGIPLGAVQRIAETGARGPGDNPEVTHTSTRRGR